MPINGSINKAYEIRDAKIAFVSLVDKAANKRTFLITKADNENANFTTIGKIVKADKKMHYVTGVVYEPLVEDSQGNFMTEDEIEKAAYYYAKNGSGVDLQHNYKNLDNASVIESYIAKCDMDIDGEAVKKGSWVMTVEVDENTFEKVNKGEITGFSMGGVGKYSTVDVEIPNEDSSAKGLVTKLAEKFGIINKGKVTDNYNRHIKEENLSIAYRSLESYLENWGENGLNYESDETLIREALTEFNEIVVNLLAENNISKALEKAALPLEKAGKKISASRLKSLKEVQSKINDIINEADEEESEVTTEQITEAVEKAMSPFKENLEKLAKSLEGQAGEGQQQNDNNPPAGEKSESEQLTEAITKAFEPISQRLSEMSETVNTIAKSRNLPSNIGETNSSGNEPETHYMHGLY